MVHGACHVLKKNTLRQYMWPKVLRQYNNVPCVIVPAAHKTQLRNGTNMWQDVYFLKSGCSPLQKMAKTQEFSFYVIFRKQSSKQAWAERVTPKYCRRLFDSTVQYVQPNQAGCEE